MKNIATNLQLFKEHPHSYEIHDTKDKKNFHIAKKDLNLAMHAKIAKMKKYSDGGEVAHYDEGTPDEKVQADDTEGAQAPVIVNVGQPQPNATSVATGQPIDANAVAPVTIPAPAPTAPAIVPEIPRAPATVIAPPAPSFSGQLAGAQAISERGLREQAAAQGIQSAADVEVRQKALAEQQQRLEAYNTARTTLDTQNTQLFQNVLNEKIDPARWVHNQSTIGRISTALGVILGGIGAGLQHSNTNQALQVVQSQIQQDIDAQKADLGKKQSLLSMNLQKYRDMATAYAATEQQMNAMVAGQLALNASRQGGALAKANADYGIGQLKMKYLETAPAIAMQEMKINALHSLNGTEPPPNGSAQILGQPAPGQAPAPIGGPSETGVSTEPEATAEPNSFQDRIKRFLAGNAVGEGDKRGLITWGNPAPGSAPAAPTAAPTYNDPATYGYGINQNRLQALKIIGPEGGLSPTEATQADKEMGEYRATQGTLQFAHQKFDTALRSADLLGRISRNKTIPHLLGGLGALAGGAAGSALLAPTGPLGMIPGAVKGAAVGAGLGEGAAYAGQGAVSALDHATKVYDAATSALRIELNKTAIGRASPFSFAQVQQMLPEQGDAPDVIAEKRDAIDKIIKGDNTYPTLVANKVIRANDPLLQRIK